MRTKPCLTADDAHRMMAACKAEAAKNGWKVAIAIVDDSGAAFLPLGCLQPGFRAVEANLRTLLAALDQEGAGETLAP